MAASLLLKQLYLWKKAWLQLFYEINNTTAEIFTQIMINFKIFHEIITVSFEEWMAATLYVTRTVILIKKRE